MSRLIGARVVGRNAAAPASEVRSWLASVLSDGHEAIGLGDHSAETVVAAAEAEGVLPLLDWRLRGRRGWELLPKPLQQRLQGGARQAAMTTLFREREIQRIAKALADAGARALLLKGNALGLWLYPQPYLRVTSDIDLLFSDRMALQQVSSVLSKIGYSMEPMPGSTIHEMKGRLVIDGGSRCELDVHERLLNAPAYAEIFSFDELWQGAIDLPSIDVAVKALSPGHAFAHACLNRALDMQVGEPDQLKLLYDVHLLCKQMDTASWEAFAELTRTKRIAGICLRTLQDASEAFGSRVPDGVVDKLGSQAENEPLDWRELQNWRYMQWQNLKALPDMRARMSWLWQRVFPTRQQLHELHGDGNWLQLIWRRFARLLYRVFGR
ncbi:nucleotidyltransferase family protein [Thermomonas sp. HDW16]|uniref:nucleotidyltransferase family protein n=1 Tax=Thermomonas sp. HDW16 TaxID=2714945 RepID=UPI0014086EE9|nr:nucleotidyltransferase family protein [Thermomonas sp. HDW16]QIL20521.1 nucleotidyltransferase family protein [Thermomonas sp. HDW16]